MIAKDIKWKIQTEDFKQTLAIDFATNIDNQNMREIEKAQELLNLGKKVEVSIKEYKNKRSLDANSYCFLLCQKIAEKIGNTKEYVYQLAVVSVGQFEILPIKDEALERWFKNWESKGLGWQSYIHCKSKLEGYTNTINYFGSSTYSVAEMSILLEEIVFQAKELDIETITPKEKEELLRKWESKN